MSRDTHSLGGLWKDIRRLYSPVDIMHDPYLVRGKGDDSWKSTKSGWVQVGFSWVLIVSKRSGTEEHPAVSKRLLVYLVISRFA
ncbi:MAG: hypothetical protein ABSD41_02690 [Candidatus Bathyarchaeia archaeon]